MALSVAEIDAAIQKINSGGQSYKIGDREFTRGDLDALRRMRNDIIGTERNSNKAIFQRVRFGGVS